MNSINVKEIIKVRGLKKMATGFIFLKNSIPPSPSQFLFKRWLTAASKLLDLTDYLFERENENNNDNAVQEPIHYPSFFSLRISLMVLMAWFTLLVANAILITVPR